MTKSKKCFKCGEIKSLDDFYKHSKMGDGHLGKCKSCTKTDTKKRYNELIYDNEWQLKEQIRARNKYHRLYKGKTESSHPETKSVRRNHPLVEGKEYHHWNYNFINSVFILNRLRGHKILHSKMAYDPVTKCYYDNKGSFLDSKEKHESFIKSLGLIYESVEL